MESAPTWDDLRVLLAVHRHRSFLAAGRALQLSTSTTSRRIEALERSLGRPLVHRSSVGTSVEPDALELVRLAEQLELGLGALKRDDSKGSSLAGTVRLSVGEGFAGTVAQVLAGFRLKHPETLIELMSENRFADISRREADIGIRVSRSTSNVLIQRSLGTLRFQLFASRSYVEMRLRDGHLRHQDFSRHDFIGADSTQQRLPQMQWLSTHGAKRFPFRSNSDAAQIVAAQHGQGIVMLVDVIGRQSEGLVPLEVELPMPQVTAWLVYHRELRQVRRVSAVAQAIEVAFKARL